jgi:Calcineurin-like phosphoesterase
MKFIGDVHGKISGLLDIVDNTSKVEPIFQLGDMGLGFEGVRLPSPMWDNFKFIRGNHDNPYICREHPNYLGEYGYLDKYKLFYLSGAFSIDRASRIERVSWWAEEELSIDQLENALTLFKELKPEIVISHECPTIIGIELLRDLLGSYFFAKMESVNSRTAHYLQLAFEAHQPKFWIFGHYHIDKTIQYKGTTFKCCAELSEYAI